MNEPKNQLVIVEGLTGLGKSTLAHFIERQYQYNGIKASRIHEGEDPHPVSINVELDIMGFMIESLEKWKAFVAQIQESGTVTVIEASFFNNLIESLFMHCLDPNTILDYGMKLQQVIKPVRPALVYLTHPDIPAALEENFRNRGPRFQDFVIQLVADTPIAEEKNWDDYDGMVKFWREFVSITDALFEAYDIDKLSIDVSSGEWDQHNQQVTDFLGLTMMADPDIDPQTAEKFVGGYKFKEDGKTHTIQYVNGTLIADIFMNVTTKLIPLDDFRFTVEKWHFELLFDVDPEGEVISFEIGGRDVSYLKAVGIHATKVNE